MASNMTQRVLFALVAIPVVLLLLWQGGIVLVLLVSISIAQFRLLRSDTEY